ncbi:hypothetical protein J6590_065441 [Homalodisca vitripennis]|nr:hypothetical protein J6590_065441 [Homalodisca vitripennis]
MFYRYYKNLDPDYIQLTVLSKHAICNEDVGTFNVSRLRSVARGESVGHLNVATVYAKCGLPIPEQTARNVTVHGNGDIPKYRLSPESMHSLNFLYDHQVWTGISYNRSLCGYVRAGAVRLERKTGTTKCAPQ